MTISLEGMRRFLALSLASSPSDKPSAGDIFAGHPRAQVDPDTWEDRKFVFLRRMECPERPGSLGAGAHIGDGSSRSCLRWELGVSRLVSDRRHFVPRRVFVTPTTLPPLEYPFHRCHELGPKWVFHWHLRRPLPARKRSLREYAVPCTLSEAAFVLVEAVLLNEPL